MKSATHHFRFGTHVGPLDAADAHAGDDTGGTLHQFTLFERTTFEIEDADARRRKRLGITLAGGRHGLI